MSVGEWKYLPQRAKTTPRVVDPFQTPQEGVGLGEGGGRDDGWKWGRRQRGKIWHDEFWGGIIMQKTWVKVSFNMLMETDLLVNLPPADCSWLYTRCRYETHENMSQSVRNVFIWPVTACVYSLLETCCLPSKGAWLSKQLTVEIS